MSDLDARVVAAHSFSDNMASTRVSIVQHVSADPENGERSKGQHIQIILVMRPMSAGFSKLARKGDIAGVTSDLLKFHQCRETYSRKRKRIASSTYLQAAPNLAAIAWSKGSSLPHAPNRGAGPRARRMGAGRTPLHPLRAISSKIRRYCRYRAREMLARGLSSRQGR